jgi:isopentenyl phosphate kinase
MHDKITLIKLGGSIITNKEQPNVVRRKVLARLVQELAAAREVTGEFYILGHGSGSFAHIPAQKYDTMNGFLNQDSRYGMAVTQNSAAELNRIVVAECLRQHLPAVSYLMSNTLVTRNRVAQSWDPEVIKAYLMQGMFPVTCGDVIVDSEQGCTIWSTEDILTFLAEHFHKQPWCIVDKIIHVTEVPGLLNTQGEVVPQVSLQNQFQVKKMIGATKGTDVTGGMWHKIQESLELAEQGIESLIIGGLEKGNLYNALLGQPFTGTVVKAATARSSDQHFARNSMHYSLAPSF